MIRPHNQDIARHEYQQREIKATLRFAAHSDRWYQEMQIMALEEIAETGLFSCYSCFEDYLVDFYASFSPDKATKQIQMVLDDPRLESIAEIIQKEFDFDLKADLIDSLETWGRDAPELD